MTNHNDLPDEFIVKAATEALTRPDSFMYYGDLPLFETWGITIGQTRDSDALTRSNYRRILADLKEEFLDDVDEFSSSHWAVGWCEQIVVRVLADETIGITPDNITPAFRKIAGIASYLSEQYPVYDDSDYSELESEENHEAFDSEWDAMISHWDTEEDGPEPTDNEKQEVYERLNDCDTPDGYWREELASHVKYIRNGEDTAS